MCDLLNLSLIDNELPFQSFVKTFPLVYGMFIRESERERYRETERQWVREREKETERELTKNWPVKGIPHFTATGWNNNAKNEWTKHTDAHIHIG